MARETILHRVRTALGRSAGQDPPPAPPARIRIPDVSLEERIQNFRTALEALAGHVFVADSPAGALSYVAALIEGKSAVASNAPLLAEIGVPSLPGVHAGIEEREELRRLCASADFGVTGADYALADTGSLVMISSKEEARMISLLPPVHIALVRKERLLTSLDELFAVEPVPSARTSSMVIITGPSRTADIEQMLVRGVHGPGQVHAIIV
jgi:L-lactate dehydrogenase complex protein LldG